MRKQKETIVTFPEWGNFSLALKLLLRSLGVKIITYGKGTNKHVETGLQYSPEGICFCFKPILGGLLETIEKGANTIFWFDSHGQCRARYYPWLQNVILKRLKKKVNFYIFDGKNALQMIKKISNKNYLQILPSLLFGYKVLKVIDKIEENTFWYRPREKSKGETDRVLTQAITIIEQTNSLKELKVNERKIQSLFEQIEIKRIKPLKLLILGEIYLIHDTFANHELLKLLGNLGFEVFTSLRASELIKHIAFHSFYRYKMERITKPYLSVDVGGHARENIMELLLNLKKDFSGVIHVGPFGCMPEVTVNPILQQITKQYNKPYLSLSFDSLTSDTGLITRLEAFSDLIKKE